MNDPKKCARCGQERLILNEAFVCLMCENEVRNPPLPNYSGEVIPATHQFCPGLEVHKGEGRKDDHGKVDWTLLPVDGLREVVLVLEHGERKYGRDNWRKVEHGRIRYLKAAFRHAFAYAKGEQTDPETGLHHLAHLTCCCLFILDVFDRRVEKSISAQTKEPA